MSEQSRGDRPGGDENDRLGPRPLHKPAVDPAQESVFGRPRGVNGAFDRTQAPAGRNGVVGPSLAPPPPEALAEAFGRAPDGTGTGLQRPPEQAGQAGGEDEDHEEPLWSGREGRTDPWRDPAAGAMLGEPAVPEDTGETGQRPRETGAQLSLPEVLFGRKVRATALALLGVVALAVGAVGGAVGWFFAEQGNDINRDVTLAEVEPGKERAAGSVAGIAERVAPAVVSIEVESGGQGGVGSGVVIDEDGYVVTNHHVVSAAVDDSDAKVTAVFTDGTRAAAKLVGSDPKTDLAVIKVNVRNPTVIQMGNSDELAPGDSVVAVGSPFGLANTVTDGIVSALHRPVTAPGENGDPPVVYDAIQTDASINPGNSGGALVDSSGALVGVNSLIRTVGSDGGRGGSIGLGFAIPVDEVRDIAEALISDGEVTHPTLGVRAKSVSAGSSQGAEVQNVQDNGAAGQAGIKEGDVITKVGERNVRNAAELTVAVREHEVGASVPVTLVRQGRELTVDATLRSD